MGLKDPLWSKLSSFNNSGGGGGNSAEESMESGLKDITS